MSLNLSAELREFVDEEIRAGNYRTEGALVADALLRMKEERERLVWLRAAVKEGTDQLDRGEGRPFDLDDTLRRLDERLRAAGKATT